MAREARKQLADLRAMEEEHTWREMHGSGKHFTGAGIVGAGATPSMGLSQFRGGAKKSKKVKYESEEEDDYEGGRISGLITSGVSRLARPSTAIVPRAPISTAVTQFGRTRLAKPSLPASYYQNLMRGAVPSASRGTSRLSQAMSTVRSGLTARNIATALSAGVPLAMLGSYLADQSGASGDAGYYEDFAGEDFGTGGVDDGGMGGYDDGGVLPSGRPAGTPTGTVPSDLSPDELAWYLQTGNLPTRYSIRTSRRQRGKGKLEIVHHEEEDDYEEVKPKKGGKKGVVKAVTKGIVNSGKVDGRSARAHVVRQVMKERGVSLAEASKIVKAEALY